MSFIVTESQYYGSFRRTILACQIWILAYTLISALCEVAAVFSSSETHNIDEIINMDVNDSLVGQSQWLLVGIEP